jgi:hypothetical protein
MLGDQLFGTGLAGPISTWFVIVSAWLSSSSMAEPQTRAAWSAPVGNLMGDGANVEAAEATQGSGSTQKPSSTADLG